MDEPKMKIVSVPLLDTGIGQEAGYASDAELIAAWEAEWAEIDALLSPKGRALLKGFPFGIRA